MVDQISGHSGESDEKARDSGEKGGVGYARRYGVQVPDSTRPLLGPIGLTPRSFLYITD